MSSRLGKGRLGHFRPGAGDGSKTEPTVSVLDSRLGEGRLGFLPLGGAVMVSQEPPSGPATVTRTFSSGASLIATVLDTFVAESRIANPPIVATFDVGAALSNRYFLDFGGNASIKGTITRTPVASSVIRRTYSRSPQVTPVPAYVQSAQGGASFSTNYVLQLGTPPTPGNFLFAAINWNDVPTESDIVAFAHGWRRLCPPEGGLCVYGKTASGTDDNIEMLGGFAGGQSSSVIAEYTFDGLNATAEIFNTATGGPNTFSAPEVTTEAGNALIVTIQWHEISLWEGGDMSAWNMRQVSSNGMAQNWMAFADQIQENGPATTYTGTWTNVYGTTFLGATLVITARDGVQSASVIGNPSGTTTCRAGAWISYDARAYVPGSLSAWLGHDMTQLGNVMLGEIPDHDFTARSIIKRIWRPTARMGAIIESPTHQRNWFPESFLMPASGFYFHATGDDTTGLVEVICAQPISVGTSNIGIAQTVLQRYEPLTGGYTTIRTSSDPTIMMTDYMAPMNVTFHYRVISTSAIGSVIRDAVSNDVYLNMDSWTISVEGAHNILIDVTSSSMQREMQTESFSPLGSTFKTVQQGYLLGRKGNITIVLSNAQRPVLLPQIEQAANDTRQTYIKTPFGVVLPVVIGAMDESFLPGGHSTMTIDYVENGAL